MSLTTHDLHHVPQVLHPHRFWRVPQLLVHPPESSTVNCTHSTLHPNCCTLLPTPDTLQPMTLPEHCILTPDSLFHSLSSRTSRPGFATLAHRLRFRARVSMPPGTDPSIPLVLAPLRLHHQTHFAAAPNACLLQRQAVSDAQCAAGNARSTGTRRSRASPTPRATSGRELTARCFLRSMPCTPQQGAVLVSVRQTCLICGRCSQIWSGWRRRASLLLPVRNKCARSTRRFEALRPIM